jgi:heme-degrading monooxygenase HmoA
MAFARPALARTGGLRFWKLVGSGQGRAFSLAPNLGRYGLLAVWESPGAADEFFGRSRLMAAYRRWSYEAWTVRLRPTRAHGAWSGSNPFLPLGEKPASGGPVAVLTRATLRPSRLRGFWRHATPATRALDGAEGLLASIGIGESPFVHQATFSLWRSEADVMAYAYQHPAHREAIRRTRQDGWYAEELFARFEPLGSEGTWNGRDPLAGG